MAEAYDLLVIGGGSAGLTAAGFAAQLGSRVALVEKDHIGGDCTWTGCVPSKTLLKAAKVAHLARTADRFGLEAAGGAVDLKKVMAHVHQVVAAVYEAESPEVLQGEGIDVHTGAARFVDPHTLAVGDEQLSARHVLIATGAHPFIPPIAGLDGVPYLTYENVWELETLPGRLLVVGGGPLGCEMAQAFRRLGSEVVLLAGRDRLLPRDEPEASRILGEVFAAEGIDVRCEARVESARLDGDEIHLAAGRVKAAGDTLLIAAGRRPNVQGLDLDKADVAHGEEGIHVDAGLCTTQEHIYAAGDCLGGRQFTHYAGWQAFVAARNALLPGSSQGVVESVPWTTFTDPEVAHVGLTEDQARERHRGQVMTCSWPMACVDRAQAEGSTSGLVKLVHASGGALLGATIVAERAGEMIHEFVVALDHGLGIGDLAGSIHVYPTYSSAVMRATAAIEVNRLLSGVTGRIVRGLAHLVH